MHEDILVDELRWIVASEAAQKPFHNFLFTRQSLYVHDAEIQGTSTYCGSLNYTAMT